MDHSSEGFMNIQTLKNSPCLCHASLHVKPFRIITRGIGSCNSSRFLCRSVLHEECFQSHLPAQPHHHVRHTAAPHLLHGSHEQHPGVTHRRRPEHRCVWSLTGCAFIGCSHNFSSDVLPTVIKLGPEHLWPQSRVWRKRLWPGWAVVSSNNVCATTGMSVHAAENLLMVLRQMNVSVSCSQSAPLVFAKVNSAMEGYKCESKQRRRSGSLPSWCHQSI